MYTIQEHMHRFALWISARAAQRGVLNFTILNLNNVFELINFRPRIQNAIQNLQNENNFRAFHSEICNELMTNANPMFTLTYGRAAKIVAMYLKTVFINQHTYENAISQLIHPPIDSILLKNLSEANINLGDIRNLNWTQFSEKEYWDLIARLENAGLPLNWTLEEFWDPQR